MQICFQNYILQSADFFPADESPRRAAIFQLALHFTAAELKTVHKITCVLQSFRQCNSPSKTAGSSCRPATFADDASSCKANNTNGSSQLSSTATSKLLCAGATFKTMQMCFQNCSVILKTCITL